MKITSAEFIKSAAKFKDFPFNDKLPEFAFIGRSNVGKSSLQNMLLERKNLVKTGKKPGKTVLLNFFLINQSFVFVDLPGYGFAKRSKEEQNRWKQTIEDYLKSREMLKKIFLLIDARHGILKNDEIMIEFLEYFGLNYTFVFTKADKLTKNQKNNLKNKYKNSLIVSSTTNLGKEEMWDYIELLLSL
jgi:GTP-binding protein